jgi:hypothetical protein
VSHTLRDEISIVEARQTLLMRLEAIGHAVDLLLGIPGSQLRLPSSSAPPPPECGAHPLAGP